MIVVVWPAGKYLATICWAAGGCDGGTSGVGVAVMMAGGRRIGTGAEGGRSVGGDCAGGTMVTGVPVAAVAGVDVGAAAVAVACGVAVAVPATAVAVEVAS